MNAPDIYSLAVPLAVIIAAVVERMSANRIKRQLTEIHELVNSRLTLALNEISELKAAALAAQKLDMGVALARIENLILNAKISPRRSTDAL
jgi:hypothetical protein